MMFIKLRKFRAKMEDTNWTGKLVFEAMDVNHIQYHLREIDRSVNVEFEARAWVYLWGWDSEKVLVSYVNSAEKKNKRLLMIINYPDMNEYFTILNKTIRLKAFL